MTSFLGLLTILFIGLKLTAFITWPWWVVLSPLYPAILLILFGYALLIWWSPNRIWVTINRHKFK